MATGPRAPRGVGGLAAGSLLSASVEQAGPPAPCPGPCGPAKAGPWAWAERLPRQGREMGKARVPLPICYLVGERTWGKGHLGADFPRSPSFFVLSVPPLGPGSAAAASSAGLRSRSLGGATCPERHSLPYLPSPQLREKCAWCVAAVRWWLGGRRRK